MSFAQKILEKYGWKEGDGLGKNNDGIAKPLKASLKFDSTGLGADKAAEFNNHWWERVFNEAANNVQIEKDGDEISMNLKNEESVEITTKDYSVRKLKQKKRDAYDNFLSSATLTNTGDEVTKPDKIEVDEIKVAPYKPLTDEELFEACGRRTAHKGARHGLKLSGKLARIEQQEKELLLKMQEKVAKGGSQSWTVVKNKKKKKEKEKPEPEAQSDFQDADEKLNSILYTAEYNIKSKKKRKEKKKTEEELSDCLGTVSLENGDKNKALLGISADSKAIKKPKKSKKSKKREETADWDTHRGENAADHEPVDTSIEMKTAGEKIDDQLEDIPVKAKKKKSKKCKHGIDKDAKEAHKQAKKLKKSLQCVTEDLKRSVLIST